MDQQRVQLPNAVDGLVPVEIYFLSDGSVAFVPVMGFSPTYEGRNEGVSSMFHEGGFSFWEPGSTVHTYQYQVAYRYKQLPLMRGWLMQQDLENPVKETR